METTTKATTATFFTRLIYLPFTFISLLPFRRLFSFVYLKELYLSFYLLRLNLIPTTLHPDPSTSLHLYIPSSRSTAKQPLLLIHGFGGNSKWQFEPNLTYLSKHFSLYIPDLLFFGKSFTTSNDRSVKYQAECLVQAMRMLGVEKYSVAGISYGGFVAYMVANMAEEEVERVVIMTAGICHTEEQMRDLVGKERRDVSEIFLPREAEDLRVLLRRSLVRPPKWLPTIILQDFIEVMYTDRRKERVELLKNLLSKGVDIKPLPVLKQESLILWGDRDTVFPICLAYQLQRHLGKKARLEVINDAGHALQMEKPNIVNHMIEWFLLGSTKSMST